MNRQAKSSRKSRLISSRTAESSKRPFRYNIFTQQIEQEEKVLEGIERYYLKLAQMKPKISKEVAIDCVVEVARENEYDPVKAYLEHCQTLSTLLPTSIALQLPISGRKTLTILRPRSTTT